MNKLNDIFNSKLFKAIESAVLVAVSYFLINYAGLPTDLVSTIAVALAGVLGIDGLATIISAFDKNNKNEVTKVN